jgi:hypothetical protein
VAVAVACALAACEDDETSAPAPQGAEPVALSPTDRLGRISMTLRGVRPSVEDLSLVASDPGAVETLVDDYLDDPGFGKVVRDLHNESLLVRIDFAYYPAGFLPAAPLDEVDTFYLNRSIQEAPLKLIEHVVTNDRPYTEIVTADYMVVNAVVAAVWGSLPFDRAGPEWQVLPWSDARPRAGILSDPWLFSRHNSTPSNANRGRANAVSRALLCNDFLTRDISIDVSIDLADPDAVKNAVRQNPACASCHQTLDPLAAFFGDYFPLYLPNELAGYPFKEFYLPGIFSAIGVELREPAYFGLPGKSVSDLGRYIAADPRFAQCAVRRFYAYFHQIDLDDVPFETVVDLGDRFVASGFDAKALARAIVLDPAFAVSHHTVASAAEDLVGVLRTRPTQLASAFADLTGFKWETDLSVAGLGRVDLVDDSFLGFQVIAGGLDGMYVTRPSHTFNATSSLFMQAYAREAASSVVASDFAKKKSERRLLRKIDAADRDEIALRSQLAWLHARILGEIVGPTAPEVDDSYDLLRGALDHGADGARAWTLVLAAMLQDVRMAMH